MIMSPIKLAYKIVAVILMSAIIFLSAGCVKETVTEPLGNESLAFSARLSDEATKAMPTVSLDQKNAKIIGYVYQNWPTEEQVNSFVPLESLDNKLFTFDGDQLVTADEADIVKWSSFPTSNNEKLKVYSYSPESLDFTTDIISDGAAAGHCLPSLTYEVPTDISAQTDIITAVSEVSTKFMKNIPLTFDHALSAIKFRSGFDESITVSSIQITNIKDSGTYTIGEGWKSQDGNQTFTITFDGGKTVQPGGMITDDGTGDVLFMIPQTFDENSEAEVILTYNTDQTIKTSLKSARWEEGRMITYTLHKEIQANTSESVYFDLAAGNVNISSAGYSGKIYTDGVVTDVIGSHDPENTYYVYQSTGDAAGYTSTDKQWKYRGAVTGWINGKLVLPDYPGVTYNSQSWSEFITDNTDVEQVIEVWDDGKYIRSDGSSAPDEGYVGTARVRDAGRTHTRNYILVEGSDAVFNLTVDDIYSVIQVPVESNQNFRNRKKGGIAYIPSGNTILNINLVGDNRMGCLHIHNHPSDKIAIEGTGSLTVADADFISVSEATYSTSDYGDTKGYISNFWNSAIGNNTHDKSSAEPYNENVYNLYFNSGTIFAGTTKAEDATAIGGGGNGNGQIFITGGKVTAVATTAGTAIGGGMGHTAHGGPGEVHISGGNIYAYNHANRWSIASSAIGGGGSAKALGSNGTVNISGGNIYAYSALGTAIGGGSSSAVNGGNATVNITGGYIVAKSGAGNGIGGGSGGTTSGSNGGTATIRISGNPIIRTGSVGGGKTNNTVGTIGSADIEIRGGDIQAQFVMAAGAGIAPSFTMYDGLIRNSDTSDEEYLHLQKNGGAVYLEDGTFTMEGGKISHCRAEIGGAIYIKGKETTSFSMNGGEIFECISETDGGALYLEGGNVSLSGGKVFNNLASNGNGGGFCIMGGNFSMPDGGNAEIYENAAFSQSDNSRLNQVASGGNGGGIYVTPVGNDVSVDIISGTIQENSSDRVGGGICVEITQKSDNAKANVTVGKSGGSYDSPSISNNHTIIMGGGLYAKGTNASVTINSGTIMNNTISGYVKNPNVANELGMVTLNGGNVTHVEVTYDNNAIYLGHPDMHDSWIQNIVTDTRSTMVVPEDVDFTPLTNLNYRFTGWNSRPDGKGTTYTPGQEMNLSNGLTLYAQWSIGN